MITADTQLALFVIPREKLQLGFELILDAMAEGRIPEYVTLVKGIPVWEPPSASVFKTSGSKKNDFVDVYGRVTNCVEVKEDDLPDELNPLRGLGYTFYRNKKSKSPDAVFFKRNGEKIPGFDSNCDSCIPPTALLDYCGLINDPFFSPVDKVAGVEKDYARLDAKILGFAVDWISKNDLGQKLRDFKDKKGIFRKYYRQRIQFLVDQKELLVIRDGRITKYRVRRPDDIEPEPAPVEVVAEVVPEPAPLRQLAPAKPSKALAPINHFLRGRQEEFERIFEDNPDMSWFRSVIADVVEVPWLEFEGQEWITVRQAGEKLGLDENTIRWHFEQFPYELSVLSTKLTGDRLKAYKLQYPGSGPTPDELNRSDRFSTSGVGVINDQSAHEFAPHFILISPAGLMWLASRSQTDVANAIMQTDWIAKAKLPGKIKEVAIEAMNFAKTPFGQQISPQDYVELQHPVKLVLEELGLTNGRFTVDLRDPAKDHILRNVNPPIDKINRILASSKFELHPLMGCTGDFIWYKWDKKNPYQTANPVIYMVFADVLQRGFHTDLVSIGIGSSKKYPRVCKEHNRIQVISNNCSGRYDVFVLELLEPKYKDEATLSLLESDLQSAFHPFWDSMIDKVVRQKWRNVKPDNGQQALNFA